MSALMSFPKNKPVRSISYLRYISAYPCIRCGIEDYSQAAHPNAERGLGQKASDLLAFPLCCTRPGILGCHAEFDRLIGITLVERRQLEITYTARMQAQAQRDNRPEFRA